MNVGQGNQGLDRDRNVVVVSAHDPDVEDAAPVQCRVHETTTDASKFLELRLGGACGSRCAQILDRASFKTANTNSA